MTTADDATERIDELQALVSALHNEVIDLRHAPTTTTPTQAPELDPSKIDLLALCEWVNAFVLTTISVRLGTDHRWCAAWWRHPDAILRLEGARRAWYALAGQEGTGLSVWWRDHMDPCLHELLNTAGTFGGCKTADDGQGVEAGHRPNAPMTGLPLPTQPEKGNT